MQRTDGMIGAKERFPINSQNVQCEYRVNVPEAMYVV